MYTSMWIVIDLWHVSYQKSTVISFYLEWYVEFYLKLQSITLASISPFLIWKKNCKVHYVLTLYGQKFVPNTHHPKPISDFYTGVW